MTASGMTASEMAASGMTASERGDATPVVRYFGPLLDVTGTGEESVSLTLPATVTQIEEQLQRLHPGLRGQRYRIAVDETFRASGETIDRAAEIALLPPFSGG